VGVPPGENPAPLIRSILESGDEFPMNFYSPALLHALVHERRGSGILRTSPVRSSTTFVSGIMLSPGPMRYASPGEARGGVHLSQNDALSAGLGEAWRYASLGDRPEGGEDNHYQHHGYRDH
jgi:hypothetical protein